MIIQRKSSVAQKSSLLFAILAYVLVVYETFLTRSGVLANSSVHSFVDLGLYNQLLLFMLVVLGVGLGMFFWRYKELPSQEKESKILSREFMTFTGATLLLILGIVIILGTSSPIIGLLFNENPTPPEISFYNDWSMPIAIIMALFTVLGQFLFWKKYDAETLATALINPIIATSVVTLAVIMFGDIRNPYYMLYIFAGFFAIIGNTWVMVRLAKRQPKLIGGSLTHVGFGLLLIGILASSAYNAPLLDNKTANYNAGVLAGEAVDERGFPISQTVEMIKLILNEPTVINNQYVVTYEGYEIDNQNRQGQQTYKLSFQRLKGENKFYLYPEVYPMLTTSSSTNINWSVDPDVRTGFFSDIYLYMAGSSHIERINKQTKKSGNIPADSIEDSNADSIQTIEFKRGNRIEVGGFNFSFINFIQEDTTSLPPNTTIGIRAQIHISHIASGQKFLIEPLFAVYSDEEKSYVLSPPVKLPAYNLSFQFSKVNPDSDSIELTITGLDETYDEEWILIVAEKKPFISVVWAGTFILMGGFSFSIYRHWERENEKNT
jgi:cytochrome c-type biogenesis protein CcmF